MVAVDWLLVAQRALNVFEAIILFSIFGTLTLCGIGGAVQVWREHEWARRTQRTTHPTTNVVTLHPRGRIYDWSQDEDGVA